MNTGGLSTKNPTLMQIYADVTGRPMKVAASEQTCAMGAALFGATASGKITLEAGQAACCKTRERVYTPIPENEAVYRERLYPLYRTLHDSFGTGDHPVSLGHIMKELIALRQDQRS